MTRTALPMLSLRRTTNFMRSSLGRDASCRCTPQDILARKGGDEIVGQRANGLDDGQSKIAILTQAVPKEVMARTAVVDKTNLQAYEIPAERRACPTLESVGAK
jgi:hypothetical protein